MQLQLLLWEFSQTPFWLQSTRMECCLKEQISQMRWDKRGTMCSAECSRARQTVLTPDPCNPTGDRASSSWTCFSGNIAAVARVSVDAIKQRARNSGQKNAESQTPSTGAGRR